MITIEYNTNKTELKQHMTFTSQLLKLKQGQRAFYALFLSSSLSPTYGGMATSLTALVWLLDNSSALKSE